MSAKNCTTHHHACDCREAMFAEMLEACSDWMEWLDGDVSHPFAADHEDKMLAAMRAAIAKAIGATS